MIGEISHTSPESVVFTGGSSYDILIKKYKLQKTMDESLRSITCILDAKFNR